MRISRGLRGGLTPLRSLLLRARYRWEVRGPLGVRALLVALGLALVLVGVGAVILSGAYEDDPTARRVPGNRPVNASAGVPTDLSGHNSPTVVRNPRDGRQLAVANRIDTPRYSCALHVSGDGGGTWRQAPIPVPRGEEPKCYAPDVAYGADGTLYLSFVTLQGRGNVPSAAWLSRSTDGARTLSTPVRLLGPLSFQVRLVADPTTAGRLYLTWLQASDVALYRFAQPGNPLMFNRSDDGGVTWGRRARVSDAARERAVAASLAVGRERDLHVLYLDLGDDRLDYEGAHGGRGGPPDPGPWMLVHARSTDGGQTWRESVVERRLVPTERFIVFIPPFPSLAADPDRGRVYASFHEGRLRDRDVWLWRSEDRGATWERPVRVNDTPLRDRTAQYLPELAVAPNGRLDVVYYDRRRDPRDLRNEVSLQSSFDGGRSFAGRVTLSERSFDSRIGFGRERGLPDLGSRLGAVSTDSGALAVWTDTRAGSELTKKQDIGRAVVAFSRPARLSAPVKYGLRVGGVVLVLAGLLAFLLAYARESEAPQPVRAPGL